MHNNLDRMRANKLASFIVTMAEALFSSALIRYLRVLVLEASGREYVVTSMYSFKPCSPKIL